MLLFLIQYCRTDISQWNAFVKLLPLWLAPNMVTLLGFLCILINVLLLQIFIPDLVGPVSYPLAEEAPLLKGQGTFLDIL